MCQRVENYFIHKNTKTCQLGKISSGPVVYWLVEIYFLRKKKLLHLNFLPLRKRHDTWCVSLELEARYFIWTGCFELFTEESEKLAVLSEAQNRRGLCKRSRSWYKLFCSLGCMTQQIWYCYWKRGTLYVFGRYKRGIITHTFMIWI